MTFSNLKLVTNFRKDKSTFLVVKQKGKPKLFLITEIKNAFNYFVGARQLRLVPPYYVNKERRQ